MDRYGQHNHYLLEGHGPAANPADYGAAEASQLEAQRWRICIPAYRDAPSFGS